MSVLGERRAVAGLAVVCGAHFLIGADGLAVAIALPDVQAGLSVAAIDLQWVLTAYGLAFGSFLLLAGRLGDLYGRRRLLVGGMALFAAGSVLAGLAPALGWLVAARAVQGLGAAAGVPAALALIGSMYPEGPARTRALSLLAAMATIGVMSGLVFGGVVTDLVGWRWVFLLLATPAVAAAVVAPMTLPEASAGREVRPDVGGALLGSAGMLVLLFGLTRIEHDGFTAVPAVWLLSGFLVLTAFVLWERRVREPLVRLSILRVRNLRAASFGIGVNGVAFTSIVYVGTLYLQNGLGYSPMRAAFAILPVDVASFVIALAGARLARRPPRLTLAVCFLVDAVALLWLARVPVPANYVIDLFLPLVALGTSLTVVFIITTHQAVADVAEDEKGLASGVFETANHLMGGAVGVAVYATVLTSISDSAGDTAGFRGAFLAAVLLVVTLGALATSQARSSRAVAAPGTDVPAHGGGGRDTATG